MTPIFHHLYNTSSVIKSDIESDIESMSIDTSIFGSVYTILYYFAIAYIIKLLVSVGVPSFSIDFPLFQENARRDVHMGTRNGGFCITYTIKTVSPDVIDVTTHFEFSGDEGKMLIMVCTLPFSLFLCMLCGIMVDAGVVGWKVECPSVTGTTKHFITSILHLTN